jgi:serine/threonine-protein kinase
MPDLLKDLNAAGERYSIQRPLGSGGMAIVYLAHDRKHDRDVALKVLRPDVALSIGSEQFLREIEIAAKLAHPGILPLYDSGKVDGFLYFVMPYVEGESLRERLSRERQLPVDDALQICRAVADALAYAHSVGVIHRDIKPENILFEAGHPVLSDFGIARAVNQSSGPLTGSGFAVGTPAYMSPEQAAGDKSIDGRSDIYSLGCVLFELLAGEPPFSGHTAQAILTKRLGTPVPRISALRDTVPRPVEAVVLKALARMPADRYRTAGEMAMALARLDTLTTDEKSIAVIPFVSMSADPADEIFADGITEEIINALSQLPGLRVVARTSAFAFKGRSEDLRTVGRSLNVAKVLEGSVRRSNERLRITAQLVSAEDGYHLWSQRYDRELRDVFAIQDEIATAIARTLQLALEEGHGRLPVKTGCCTENIEAYERYLKGRALLSDRGRSIVDGLQLLEEAAALDPQYAPAQAGLADSYSLLGLYGLAPPAVMEKARAAAVRAITLDESLPDAHASLGFVHLISGWDWDSARQCLGRALALNPNAVDARCWHAVYLATVDQQFDEAICQIHQALSLDPLASHPLGYLGVVCLGARRYRYGVAELQERERDAKSFLFIWTLGVLREAAGQPEEGIRTLEKALAMSGRHPFALGSIGCTLCRMGRRDEARAILHELLARARREYVAPMVFMALYAALDCLEDAVTWLERAHQTRSPGLPIILMWPYYDSLRGDPRFTALRDAMRLPAEPYPAPA